MTDTELAIRRRRDLRAAVLDAQQRPGSNLLKSGPAPVCRRDGGRARVVNAIGVRRRMQALHAIGWPWHVLAEQLGRDMWAVEALLTLPRVTHRTAIAVHRLFDRLAMTPGPCDKARSRAKSRGWLPPLAWDDDDIDRPSGSPAGGRYTRRRPCDEVDAVVVERAICGRGHPALTRAERVATVAAMAAQGHSDTVIGAHLGCSHDAVLKIRLRAGIASRYVPR